MRLPHPLSRLYETFVARPAPVAASPLRTVSLALQGGGSHGAYTWGVLERLLEESDWLKFEGISGTSAGALNAAFFVQGYDAGGADGAKRSLERFWHGVSKMPSFGLPRRSASDKLMGNWNLDSSPGAAVMHAWQKLFSPYDVNPLNINPLRDMLSKLLDMEAIRHADPLKLFVCATNVETGRPRIFQRQEMTLDMLMASICLPHTFQAVTIGSTPYWDGGYVGNPAIFPLINKCETSDIIIVPVNPLTRPGTPVTRNDIINRLNEISFNVSLMAEMRTIALAQMMAGEEGLKGSEAERLRGLRIHVIGAEEDMRAFGAASKFNVQLDFLKHLNSIGYNAADRWLRQNRDAIGKRSSADIRRMFL